MALRRLLPFAREKSGETVALSRFEPTAAQGETPSAPLRTVALERHYGSLKVLNGIAIESRGSELLSIVGPNGAGKTTLMRCISDGSERTGGQVFVNGTEIGRGSPQTVVALGIGRSFQNTNLFETLTVAECLMLGLTKAERTSIGDVLTALARDYGLSILLIEHDLDFVREISDRIVVLHQGALLMEGTVEEVIASELVRAVYSGQGVGAAS